MKQQSSCVEEQKNRLSARAIQARVAADGRPFIVAHFITSRCMCKCASCLWINNESEDVPLEDVKRLYAEAKEEGFVAAALSGGEPFLRKDLGDIVRFVKEEAEMAILLFTTGRFLKTRMDEALPWVDMLMISLDSARAERHDEIRGLPGLYDSLMEGVKLVKQKYPGISVQFNCCVQKGIRGEIDDMTQIAKDLGVHISFDVITEYRHDGKGGQSRGTDSGLPLTELQDVCRYLLEKKKETDSPILNSNLYFKYFADGKPGYKCHFPKLAISISGNGDVEDCLNLSAPVANIRNMPLKEIMELPRFKQLRADCEKCSSCNSPTMVDLSNVWENPSLVFEHGGIRIA